MVAKKNHFIDSLLSDPTSSFSDSIAIFISKLFNNYFSHPHLKVIPRYRSYMMTHEALLNIQHLLFATIHAHIPGDVIEIGCYEGNTAILLAKVLKDFSSKKKLVLYDSFHGLQKFSSQDSPLFLKEGGCCSTIDTLDKSFDRFQQKYDRLVPGNILMTLPRCLPKNISFAHIDVDLYRPTLHALQSIFPRMEKGGIIILDDYGDPFIPGVKKAVSQFFKNKKPPMKVLYAGEYPWLKFGRQKIHGKQILAKYQAYFIT